MNLLLLLFPTFVEAFTYSVTDIRGSEAFYSQSGSTILNKLQSSTKLADDDTVQTVNNSSVFLLSSAGHKISIGPNSAIFLATARDGGDEYTIVTLLRGFVRSIVNGNGKHTKTYELKTTSVSIGVRGTDFLSRLEGDSLQVYLREGVLALPNKQELTTGNKAVLDSSGIASISQMQSQEFNLELEKSNLGNSDRSAPISQPSDPTPNARNSDSGKTELMLAIEQKDVNSIKRLLASGAAKNEKDSQGRTAYDYARLSANKEIQDLLFR